jgi:hypothetical protein
MPHLIGTKHKRRVLFTEKAMYHRSDQSVCKSYDVKIGKTVLSHWTAVELAKPGAHVIGCPCGCQS